MAESELLHSISSLTKKIDYLIQKQIILNNKVRELENSNRELKIMHENDLKTLENYKKEIEFLSLSHRLASSPEALISARKKINGMKRTIDSCIRMLQED